ncbi:Hypothetical predicted protein, partial [Prunus dulcis]
LEVVGSDDAGGVAKRYQDGSPRNLATTSYFSRDTSLASCRHQRLWRIFQRRLGYFPAASDSTSLQAWRSEIPGHDETDWVARGNSVVYAGDRADP